MANDKFEINFLARIGFITKNANLNVRQITDTIDVRRTSIVSVICKNS